MTGILVDLGYVPVGFHSAPTRWPFTAHPDRFDAVITDARMPGSGVQLIRALREVRPAIPS